MFSENICSIDFEETINFVEFWAISSLKWKELKNISGGYVTP